MTLERRQSVACATETALEQSHALAAQYRAPAFAEKLAIIRERTKLRVVALTIE
jgi:hypothetical protein